jgi:hypothetical protein
MMAYRPMVPNVVAIAGATRVWRGDHGRGGKEYGQECRGGVIYRRQPLPRATVYDSGPG